MATSASFKSPMCRLSYARGLYKVQEGKDGGKPKFRVTLIFPKTDLVVLEPYVRNVIVEEWGDAGLKKAAASLIRSPFLKGDGKEAHNSTTGELNPGLGPEVFFIRATAEPDHPPFVSWKDPNIQMTEQDVYSGCYGKAVLHAFTWPKKGGSAVGGQGVTFGIEGFQKLREGDRLGNAGGTNPEKYHETVEDLGDAPAETQGGAGAGGLFGG
jgi:hypothetical protein